jgi:hypothetical protein
MNITCSQFDDLLFDGSPLAMENASLHAETCAGCAEKLASWKEISSVAESLHTTWESDLLWPRIERALREEKQKRPASWLRHAAAASLLILSLGGTLFYAVREQSQKAAFDEVIVRTSALDEVERAERAHLAAIANLEKLAEAKLEEQGTPLMVSYKEKLMLLDDAIAECETNIAQNRQNAHLRRQLQAMYSEKQQTLRDVLREETHVTTP